MLDSYINIPIEAYTDLPSAINKGKTLVLEILISDTVQA